MRTSKSLTFTLFLISVALIPLTVSDHRLVINLGEYRNETYVYPLLLLILISLLKWFLKGKISIPYKAPQFQFLFLFVISCLIVSVFSLPSILSNDLKGTQGLTRLMKQSLSLIFSAGVVPLTLYNCLKSIPVDRLFDKLTKVIIGMFVIVFLIGLLQILSVIFLKSWAHELIMMLNGISPFLYILEDFPLQRISSISHEPPFLGMYLVFVVPWILYNHYNKPKRIKAIALVIMALILVFASKSRAAQLFCLTEILFFYTLLFIKKKEVVIIFVRLMFLLIIMTPILFIWKGDVVLDFIEQRMDSFKIIKNIETNNSNKTRLGTIVAGLDTFSEHPLVGVGWGQQGYYIIDRYPEWSKKGNWEIERYLDKNERNFPPGFNIYVRLLAETGIVGFSLFILFLYLLIFINYKRYTKTGSVEYLLFLTIFVGLSFNWIQIDTPRIYSFWITFVLYLIYDRKSLFFRSGINSINPSLQ